MLAKYEVYDFVWEAVHKSLKDGLFLWGREDENMSIFFFVLLFFFIHVLWHLKGRCKNLAHPAIPTIIHEFFHTDKDCLAALFCNDFEHTVPDYAIALVVTCVSMPFSYQMTCANISLGFKIVSKNMLTSVIGRQSI